MFGKKRAGAPEEIEVKVKTAEEEKEEIKESGTEQKAPATEEKDPLRISADEREEFEEFRRQKKILEIKRLLKMIDHTLLKQTATREDIRRLCREAKEYGFYSVCVQPVYVDECFRCLKDAQAIKIACVVGFPMGENKTETKVYETKRAIADGADELDMVACISAIKNGDYGHGKKEIKTVVAAPQHSPVKVIIDTSILTLA